MTSSSIVISGMGVISPLGLNASDFQKNLFAGKVGIESQPFSFGDHTVSYPCAPIKDFDVSHFFDPKKAAMMDRFSQFAVAAAVQAFKDSGLNLSEEQSQRTGIITGTGVGGQNTIEESYQRLIKSASTPRVHPFTIPRLMANAGSSQISMALGLKGMGFTVASACASAVHAMGVALHLLRSGMIDRVVTGGAESCLTYGTLKGWEALRVMAPDLCRPFSEGRAGMVLGEGAAMFVLERREDAEARGAKIYAEFAGIGMSSDAKDITTPDTDGAARAIIEALKDAGIAPEDVDYINAHGTGTRINDASETIAIKKALGDHAKKIAVSSSKSMFGHALGAAGALEMVATVLAVQNNIAPPTMNYQTPDPECDLDCVPNKARAMDIKVALNNTFAFGGLNAVAVLKKA